MSKENPFQSDDMYIADNTIGISLAIPGLIFITEGTGESEGEQVDEEHNVVMVNGLPYLVNSKSCVWKIQIDDK